MAVGHSDHPRRRWVDALFGEARERGRRRRRRYLIVALLCAAVAVAVAAVLRHGRVAGAGLAGGTPVNVGSRALPAGGHYSQIAAAGDHIVVTAGTEGYSLLDGRVTGSCRSVTIDPRTLRAITAARGNCGDPALYGRRVLPVIYVLSHSGPTGLILGLRIARVSRAARGGYRLGPRVLSYSQCSDCQIAWIYGDGSLWIYSPQGGHGNGPHGALYRVSDRTGRVLERWRMPSFLRALLAVDRDGLWVSQSLYGGMPSGVPPMQRVDYRSLYRVAPGMRSPLRARQLGSGGAYWIVAAGHSVWVDQSGARGASRLWRLEGRDARAVIRARPLPSGAACGQTGTGQATIAGSEAAGIYCQNAFPGSSRVPPLRSFDPMTGAARLLTVKGFMGPAVSLGSSVFFLGGPRWGAGSRVYRVWRSGAT